MITMYKSVQVYNIITSTVEGEGAALKGHRAGPLEMAKRGLWLENVWSLMRALKDHLKQQT